jgi:hypothetical protein
LAYLKLMWLLATGQMLIHIRRRPRDTGSYGTDTGLDAGATTDRSEERDAKGSEFPEDTIGLGV